MFAVAADFPPVADFPCYILVGAVVPSLVVVEYTRGYSVAFDRSYSEVVAAAAYWADSLRVAERMAAVVAADKGQVADSWMVASDCSPWRGVAAEVVVAAEAAILGARTEAVYDYRRLEFDDADSKNGAGIDFVRVRVGFDGVHDHAIDLDCCCRTNYDQNGSDETTMDVKEYHGEIECHRACID